MAVLAFVLECAAIAAFIGTAAAIFALITWRVARPMVSRLSASARADAAFTFGVIPAVAVIAGTTAAATPPILSALGLLADHCANHSHHLHICIVHSAGLRAALATIGAFALALSVFRACSLLKNTLVMSRDIARLEQLGERKSASFPIVEVPGAPRLCHAIGLFKRRILLSSDLVTRLEPLDLACALAHERAHLHRRDPLANLLLSLAEVFQSALTFGVFQRAYRTAAEEACDDVAASTIGDATRVAQALVAVAALQHGPSGMSAPAHAFGEHALERRVRRLLAGSMTRPRRARALLFGASGGLCVLIAAMARADEVHHSIETLLQRLF